MLRTSALALAALIACPAAAEDRPSEGDLFGAPATAPASAPAEPPAPQPPAAGAGRDEAILGGASARPSGVLSAAQENPLAIGGLAYLRATTVWYRDQAPARWRLSSPNLVDLYVDARPNDRVRAFALARTFWDPLAPPAGTGLVVASKGADPRAVLDQLWVNFDVRRKVFVTAGRQHVKWGVGRFWNPTDYLHPIRRDPLAQFDDRAGTTMVKLHVPWEAKGWNFYGMAVLDDPAGRGDAASEVGKVAGGARAEVVIGGAELGADALVRDGQRPRFGLDFSTALWDFDLHGEVALRTSSDVQLWRDANPGAGSVLLRYEPRKLTEVTPQAVVGLSYAVNYSDEDAIRFAAEYFYNGLGYDDAHIYPWLLLNSGWLPALGIGPLDPAVAVLAMKGNDFTPFYAGRHYAGLNVILARPGSWNDHTFSLSAIANLSDGSAILRLDHSVIVDTWLTVESFVAANVGKEGGEFRFALDIPPQAIGPTSPLTEPIVTAPPVLSGGVALRVKL